MFEVNFQSTSPRGVYIWRGDLTEGYLRYRFWGFYMEGLIFGILRYLLFSIIMVYKYILYCILCFYPRLFQLPWVQVATPTSFMSTLRSLDSATKLNNITSYWHQITSLCQSSYQPRSQGSLSCFEKELWLRMVAWKCVKNCAAGVGPPLNFVDWKTTTWGRMKILTSQRRFSFWVACKLLCFRLVAMALL